MWWLRRLLKNLRISEIKTFIRRHRWSLVISGAVTLVSLLFFVFVRYSPVNISIFQLLDQYESRTLDARFAFRGKRPVDPRIVIVAIDQTTVNRLGYPFARVWHARMLNRLTDGGARAVGMDIDFPFPDRSSPTAVLKQLEDAMKSGGLQPDTGLLSKMQEVAQQADSDAQFAAALKRAGNVTLGHTFFEDESAQKGLDQKAIDQYNDILGYQAYPQIRKIPEGARFRFFVAHPQRPDEPYKQSGIEPNLRIFADAAHYAGFFNNLPDSDGIFRHAPLIVEYPEKVKTQLEQNFFPSLPVQVIREYLKAPLDETIFWFHEGGPDHLTIANKGVKNSQLDLSGRVLVNFAGPAGSYPTYSLVDVAEGKVPAETFKDKIVYVGATAVAVVSDLRPSPFDKTTYPGVEIHANVTDNILNDALLSRGVAEEITDLWILLICGVVMGLVFVGMRPSLSWVALVAAGGLLVCYVYFQFKWNGRWLDIVIPVFTLAANYVGVTSYRVIFEEREKRRVRGAFGHYVHPGLITQMMKNPDLLRLGGEEVNMTVMFSDVRGFTSISEKLTPQQLVALLNEYLTVMSDIIMANWGTVDKYEGDAIMAFWGRPYPQLDHASRACRAGLIQLAHLQAMNKKWKVEGRLPLDIGIGFNTGPMVVGNMGSNKRFNYTVMGDAVNLGSRLEGQNKEYGTKIIISQSTYEEVREEFVCRELDLIRVKGKLRPVAIHELMAEITERSKYQGLIAIFAQGLTAYRAGRFEQALGIFEEILSAYPEDGPSKLFAKRCRMYLQAPPPAWDGVFVATSK